MRSISFLIILTIGIIAQAQSVIPLMSAGVRCSMFNRDNSYVLSPEMVAEGNYERVELLEIDNTLVLRCEEGKSNEYGFIEDESRHSIMFKISNLTYEWIDSYRQEGILFKGICSNKQLGYDLPFVLCFNISDSDILAVGDNVKTLGEVRNYDLNRLFEYGKVVVHNSTSTPKTDYKKKVIGKHKPKLTK